MIKCPYCEREFKHQGALNLHLDRNKECKVKHSPVKSARCNCEDNLQMLDKNNKVHLGAIGAGYTYYCTKCEEVFK